MAINYSTIVGTLKRVREMANTIEMAATTPIRFFDRCHDTDAFTIFVWNDALSSERHNVTFDLGDNAVEKLVKEKLLEEQILKEIALCKMRYPKNEIGVRIQYGTVMLFFAIVEKNGYIDFTFTSQMPKIINALASRVNEGIPPIGRDVVTRDLLNVFDKHGVKGKSGAFLITGSVVKNLRDKGHCVMRLPNGHTSMVPITKELHGYTLKMMYCCQRIAQQFREMMIRQIARIEIDDVIHLHIQLDYTVVWSATVSYRDNRWVLENG